MYWYIILSLIIGYLLGSIPFGYLLGRCWKGIDIRQYGSGNIGATNVWRTLGVVPGVVVLLADMAKGAVSILIARYIFGGDFKTAVELSAAVGALLGHSASLFLRFKGGKLVATGAGIIFILSPISFFIGLGLFIVTVAITKYVSAGSIIAALSVPINFYLQGMDTPYVIFTVIIVTYAIYRHRSNIKRIISGTEFKIGQKRK